MKRRGFLGALLGGLFARKVTAAPLRAVIEPAEHTASRILGTYTFYDRNTGLETPVHPWPQNIASISELDSPSPSARAILRDIQEPDLS